MGVFYHMGMPACGCHLPTSKHLKFRGSWSFDEDPTSLMLGWKCDVPPNPGENLALNTKLVNA